MPQDDLAREAARREEARKRLEARIDAIVRKHRAEEAKKAEKEETPPAESVFYGQTGPAKNVEVRPHIDPEGKRDIPVGLLAGRLGDAIFKETSARKGMTPDGGYEELVEEKEKAQQKAAEDVEQILAKDKPGYVTVKDREVQLEDVKEGREGLQSWLPVRAVSDYLLLGDEVAKVLGHGDLVDEANKKLWAPINMVTANRVYKEEENPDLQRQGMGRWLYMSPVDAVAPYLFDDEVETWGDDKHLEAIQDFKDLVHYGPQVKEAVGLEPLLENVGVGEGVVRSTASAVDTATAFNAVLMATLMDPDALSLGTFGVGKLAVGGIRAARAAKAGLTPMTRITARGQQVAKDASKIAEAHGPMAAMRWLRSQGDRTADAVAQAIQTRFAQRVADESMKDVSKLGDNFKRLDKVQQELRSKASNAAVREATSASKSRAAKVTEGMAKGAERLAQREQRLAELAETKFANEYTKLNNRLSSLFNALPDELKALRNADAAKVAKYMTQIKKAGGGAAEKVHAVGQLMSYLQLRDTVKGLRKVALGTARNAAKARSAAKKAGSKAATAASKASTAATKASAATTKAKGVAKRRDVIDDAPEIFSRAAEDVAESLRRHTEAIVAATGKADADVPLAVSDTYKLVDGKMDYSQGSLGDVLRSRYGDDLVRKLFQSKDPDAVALGKAVAGGQLTAKELQDARRAEEMLRATKKVLDRAGTEIGQAVADTVVLGQRAVVGVPKAIERGGVIVGPRQNMRVFVTKAAEVAAQVIDAVVARAGRESAVVALGAGRRANKEIVAAARKHAERYMAYEKEFGELIDPIADAKNLSPEERMKAMGDAVHDLLWTDKRIDLPTHTAIMNQDYVTPGGKAMEYLRVLHRAGHLDKVKDVDTLDAAPPFLRALLYLHLPPGVGKTDKAVVARSVAALKKVLKDIVENSTTGNELATFLDESRRVWGSAEGGGKTLYFWSRAIMHGASMMDTLNDLARVGGTKVTNGAAVANAMDFLAARSPEALGKTNKQAIAEALRVAATYGTGTKEKAFQGIEAAGPWKGFAAMVIGKSVTGSNELITFGLREGHNLAMPKSYHDALTRIPSILAKELTQFSDKGPKAVGLANLLAMYRYAMIMGVGAPKPGYFMRMEAGDWSQMAVERGIVSASAITFWNLQTYIPKAARTLAEKIPFMQDAYKRLPTVGLGPDRDLAVTLHSSKEVVHVREGLIEGRQLLQEAFEDGVWDAITKVDLDRIKGMESFQTRAWRKINGFVEGAGQILEANQKRKRLAFYVRLRTGKYGGSPMTREEAGETLRRTLYDWSMGTADWERNGVLGLMHFWSYKKHMLRQLGEWTAAGATGSTTWREALMYQGTLGKLVKGTNALDATVRWSGENDESRDDPKGTLERNQAVEEAMPTWWVENKPVLFNRLMTDFEQETEEKISGTRKTHMQTLMFALTTYEQMSAVVYAMQLAGFSHAHAKAMVDGKDPNKIIDPTGVVIADSIDTLTNGFVEPMRALMEEGATMANVPVPDRWTAFGNKTDPPTSRDLAVAIMFDARNFGMISDDGDHAYVPGLEEPFAKRDKVGRWRYTDTLQGRAAQLLVEVTPLFDSVLAMGADAVEATYRDTFREGAMNFLYNQLMSRTPHSPKERMIRDFKQRQHEVEDRVKGAESAAETKTYAPLHKSE